MRRLFFFIILLILPLFLASGCGSSEKIGNKSNLSDSGSESKAMKVVVEGGGKFPEFLAGKWKGDDTQWEFVFEEDGRISSAVIEFGNIKLRPGKTTTKPSRYGGKGVYTPGKWLVAYDTRQNILSVIIEVKHFYQDMKDSALEGSRTDILSGKVDANSGYWEAGWHSKQTYIAHLAKQDKPVKFEDRKEPVFRRNVFFRKQ